MNLSARMARTNLQADLVALREASAALCSRGPTPFPLPVQGLEAVVAGAVRALEPSDWYLPGLRERVGGVLREVPLERLVDGQAGARPYKLVPPGPGVAARALTAVGLAHASGEPALVHLGTASTADGAFHEALNLSVALKAPVIFLVAVHPLSGDAPLPTQLHARPSALAKAFGLGVHEVDGNVASAVHAAVTAARAAGGPHLIEATLRPDAPCVA